jgi:hypothetical protein
LEKTAAAPDSKKMEIEYANVAPSASKIIHVAASEATVGPVKEIEAKNSKTEERPMWQSPPTTTGLPKLTTATTMTPRKGRRMTSVLDAVLKSLKVPTPASTKARILLHALKLDLRDLSQRNKKRKIFRRSRHRLHPKHRLVTIWNILFAMLLGNNYQNSKLPKCNITQRT